LWLIGARGSVATTVSIGLSALRRGAMPTTGLVSQLAPFAHLNLINFDQVVIGGHEIRRPRLIDEAYKLHESTRAFERSRVDDAAADLEEIDACIRPGVLHGVGPTIAGLADAEWCGAVLPSAGEAVQRVAADLEEFRRAHSLARIIVINLASTEPPFDARTLPTEWDELAAQLAAGTAVLPASTIYAIGALNAGTVYINFTPSVGSDLAALQQLARLRRTCHMGRDGKTGETLVKSALAPMFAMRNLEVMSWVGHNIFGNLDGQVLDDPANKKTKVTSKDALLAEVLGYAPQTHISIEFIRSLGDWKTAWDHIHFRGFLGVPMTMQFTWQGCDSMLAAPLVVDLLRFADRAARDGAVGELAFLASFFKSPMGSHDHALAAQFQQLTRWAAERSNGAKPVKD
jgi:myo-inositol-1-phosphate synthase